MINTSQELPDISITREAADHVRHFTGLEGKSDAGVRVGVKGGGCSGLTYFLETVDRPQEGDEVIEEHGVRFFIDQKSYASLAGSILEYSGGLNGKGFVFNNPNARTTCGCGTSFSV